MALLSSVQAALLPPLAISNMLSNAQFIPEAPARAWLVLPSHWVLSPPSWRMCHVVEAEADPTIIPSIAKNTQMLVKRNIVLSVFSLMRDDPLCLCGFYRYQKKRVN